MSCISVAATQMSQCMYSKVVSYLINEFLHNVNIKKYISDVFII